MNNFNKAFSKLSSLPPNQKLVGSLKIFFNYLAAAFRLPQTPPPVEIQIEPSSRCNLRCSICNLKNYQSKHSFLSPASLEKLVRQLKPIQNVNLTGMGESLLNPQFIKLLTILNRHHVSFTFITNGQLLNPILAQKVLSQKPKAIIVSIDATDKKYENIRLGASFPLLVKNLTHLFQLSQKLSPKTELILNTVLIHRQEIQNQKDIESIIKLADRVNFSRVTFQNVFEPNTHLQKYHQNHSRQLTIRYQKIQTIASRYHQPVTLPQTHIKPNSCYYPWIYPQITSSGELLPCCLIPQFGPYQEIIDRYSFGNVFDQPFNRVWNSPRARVFRRQLSSSNPPSPCRFCPKYLGIL